MSRDEEREIDIQMAVVIENFCIFDGCLNDVDKILKKRPDVIRYVSFNILERFPHKDFKIYTYLLSKKKEYEKRG